MHSLVNEGRQDKWMPLLHDLNVIGMPSTLIRRLVRSSRAEVHSSGVSILDGVQIGIDFARGCTVIIIIIIIIMFMIFDRLSRRTLPVVAQVRYVSVNKADWRNRTLSKEYTDP